MGTSKSYSGIKGNPNWSNLSSSVTRNCDNGNLSDSALNKIVSNFSKLLGGSNYGGRGRSNIGGRAGLKTAQKLGGFLDAVKLNGFKSALAGIGFKATDTTQVNDTINYLLEYCAGVAATLDETAAKAAEKQLLQEIESDAKSFSELEKIFEEKIKDYGIEELLIKYYAFYIYEHLSIDFYEKLIEEKGKIATTKFFTQLKDFLFESVKNISRKSNLDKINWAGIEGDKLVKDIFEDTLKEFKDYES